jgi:hypothetical protein
MCNAEVCTDTCKVSAMLFIGWYPLFYCLSCYTCQGTLVVQIVALHMACQVTMKSYQDGGL